MQYLLYLGFLCSATFIASAASSSDRLKDVNAIYVAPLEVQDHFGVLRAKLIIAVSKIPGLFLVEEPKKADAILTGSGQTQRGISDDGRAYHHIQARMRLISKGEGVVLWSDNLTDSPYVRSGSSSFADNVANSLGRLFTDRQKK